MKVTPVGNLDLGITGRDEFFNVELEESDCLAIEQQSDPRLQWVKSALDEQLLFESSGPGRLFCDRVSLLPFPYSEDRFVVVRHVRRDC